MSALTALVLAGRRGPSDPLAAARGARHRALLPVAGVPMLLRVVRTLRATPAVGSIVVSIDDPKALAGIPELAALLEAGGLEIHASLDSPSRSVHDALTRIQPREAAPVLVTTADHALLTPEMVEHFVGCARSADADVLVGVVAASRLRAEYPETTRTYIPLRGEAYSGANLFVFRTAASRRAAAFWVRAERFRKQPWRLVRSFGPATLALFALRRLDLDTALARVSRAMGVRVAPVRLPFSEAAIDVDRASDLDLAERILAQRSRSPSPEKQPATGS